MTSQTFSSSLQTIAKRIFIVLMGVMVVLSFFQAAASANPSRTDSTPKVVVALAASSRFAAQAELKGQEPMVSESRVDELREKRREWQSEVSAEAEAENTAENDSKNPVDNVVKDKLNLNEITEENEIVDTIKNR